MIELKLRCGILGKIYFIFDFVGKYGDAEIVLSNNKLTQFESSVFRELLETIAVSDTGFLYLSESESGKPIFFYTQSMFYV